MPSAALAGLGVDMSYRALVWIACLLLSAAFWWFVIETVAYFAN